MMISPRLPLVALALALSPAAALAQAPAAAPAAAATQAPARQFVPGLAIANKDAIVAGSNAYRNAISERQIVYKNQMAMAEARRKQINAELEPMVKKFKDDQLIGSVSATELQQRSQAIQSLQQSGLQELQAMLAPITRSETYVKEQIDEAFGKAMVAAMDKRGITLVVPSQTLLAFNNGYVLNGDVVAELNTILPKANVVPPEGWLPAAERQAAAAAAQAAQPARPAPASRRRQ